MLPYASEAPRGWFENQRLPWNKDHRPLLKSLLICLDLSTCCFV